MVIRLLKSILFLGVLLLAATTAFSKNLKLEESLRADFAAGNLNGLHGALVIKDGNTLAEVYFEGIDQKWGVPLGRREHTAETLHDLRSVTKSIVGLLYGIALFEGLVPGLDECLVCQFPQYQDLIDDPERQKILVRHALTMQMGTKWNENLPYSNPQNSEIAMEISPDRYRFVLDRPLVQDPGQTWIYNGGATAVIAHLIARGAGKPLDIYAKEKLFDPLGIDEFEWIKGSNREPSAASGLRMKPHDLAKIGELLLKEGHYNGQQIVPSDWIKSSLSAHTTSEEDLRYGYFWWLAPQGDPPLWAAGFGNGGQRLFINKGLGLVIVIFTGNYNMPASWELPNRVILEVVIPTVLQALE
ncbi:MAG: serine hydrolase [Pseudomonadota bacterium]